jgi:hypothetical protein
MAVAPQVQTDILEEEEAAAAVRHSSSRQAWLGLLQCHCKTPLKLFGDWLPATV